MKYVFVLLLSFMQLACEPLPEVKVINDDHPRFRLSGRADTRIFSICCKDGTAPDGYESYIWEIRNISHQGRPIDVEYGLIPTDFRQVTPTENRPPPSLVPGRKYSYWAQGIYGAKVGCFEITERRIVEVPCNDGK
jgi:hypothetical protein